MRTLLLVFLLSIHIVNAQDVVTLIKAKAVEINTTKALDQQVYNLLADKQLIMIGEMHGTNEPAHLVTALGKLFTRHQDSIQIGFEIPSSTMASS